LTAFVANTNFLELIGLMDALTDAYINNASVAVTTIEDEDGNAVFPLSGSPITMDYVAASNGNYRGLLLDTLPFVAGVCYIAHIDVDASGRIGHWEFRFKPLTRTTR